MNSVFFIKCFEYTAEIISQQVSAFTPNESLVQPYGGSHSINWLLGHILSSRSFPLKLLGEAQVWAERPRSAWASPLVTLATPCSTACSTFIFMKPITSGR